MGRRDVRAVEVRAADERVVHARPLAVVATVSGRVARRGDGRVADARRGNGLRTHGVAATVAPSEDARRRRLGTHDGAAGGAARGRTAARPQRGGGYDDLLIFKYLFESGSSETLG